MTSSTAISRLNLHEMLVAGIREMVLEGRLRPGEKVPEQQLCEHFAVSRTPLREALKVLAAEGMLQLLPRRGAIVAQLTPEEIDELYPIMATFESLAGELLCRRVGEGEIAQMQTLHDRMMQEYRAGDEAAYLRSNRAFHEALFDLAGNATLRAFYRQILTRIRSSRFAVRKDEASWRRAVEEHEQIMKALAARDGRRLSRLLRRHVMDTTIEIARTSLQTRPAEQQRLGPRA